MADTREGYVPNPEFQKDTQESLVDIQLNENTELWLVQLPPDDKFPEIDGQKLTLDLNQDGELGSVKGPDGIVYSLFNFPSDVADTTVFQPTPSGTNIAGKISRHVSFIHYPDPKQVGTADVGQKNRMPLSSKTTLTKSVFSTPTRTTTHKSGSSSKSGLSRQSGDSGPGLSGVSTVSGSSQQSHRSNKKPKVDGCVYHANEVMRSQFLMNGKWHDSLRYQPRDVDEEHLQLK